MIKMNCLTASLFGAVVATLPLAATAQDALAVSLGATFDTTATGGATGAEYDGTTNTITTGPAIETLAVSVASGTSAAVTNSTALTQVANGSTSNAGASNTNSSLESGLNVTGTSYTSDVFVSQQNKCDPYYGCYPY